MADPRTRFTHRKVALETMGHALEKWPSRVLEEGFTPFPKRLTRCLGRVICAPLGMDHLAVVLAIVDFRRANLKRNASVDYLAFKAGLSESRFEACLDDLSQRRLIHFATDQDGGLVVNLDGLAARIREETETEP